MGKMFLMCKDTPVMSVNTDENEYLVLAPECLPYQLRNKLRKIPDAMPTTKHELNQYIIASQKNYEAIISYAASRVLPLTRANAKKIYQLFNFEQLQDDYSKAKIAFLCKSLSLQDNYWFKAESDKSTWADVNLRTNHLNEVVAQVALHGSSLSLTGSLCTPELNGQGAYAKAWKREDDGLYLLKRSAPGSNESEIEVMVSNLLDKCNVDHVTYTKEINNDVYCSKCKCMTTDELSILPAMDYEAYCNRNGLNFLNEVKRIDADNFYKMCVVDYLISNRDRHGMNWGFYYDSNNMEIKGLHPLFDHNNAFDVEYMKNKDAKYLAVPSMTTKEAALAAIKRTDFHFKEPVTREDFLNDEQYRSFKSRAKDLGLDLTKTKNISEVTKLLKEINTHSARTTFVPKSLEIIKKMADNNKKQIHTNRDDR